VARHYGIVRLVGVSAGQYLELRRTLWICAFVSAVFVCLFVFGIRLRVTAVEWPKAFQFGSLLMSVAMTSFALAASVTAECGARTSRHADVEPSVRWLAIAIACWLVFLFLEIVEWVRLIFIADLGFGTQFGQVHLLITGFHWVAVLGGIGWLTWAIANVRRQNLLPAALFTHCLNFWWLAIMVIQYFSNASLSGF
jgi:cytochrome aa3-600 menaquinol oxidase subunit 3